MTQPRRSLALLLALGVMGYAAPAWSQDAKALLKKADKLFAAGDYKAALEAYEAGHKLQPQPVFLRSMGYSLLKLYQHGKAREKLREYLKAAPKAGDRAKITDLLGTLDVIVETVLKVTSTPPGAALYIDTEAAGQVGTTPFEGSIPPGQHTLILKLAPYRTTVKSFTAPARKTTSENVALEVPLKVSSTPSGASVHLDSESAPALGVTPISDGGIGVGKRTVFVKLAGYRTFKQELEVSSGAVEIKAELTLGIKVVSSPPGATVELDGKALAGVTPLEEAAAPGKHQVVVKLEGFKPFTTEIEVAPGKDNTVNAALGGALLTMRADLDGAKVTVGGRELGASPLEKGAVPLGKHLVSVTHPDRRPWSREIDFEEGQAVRARVRLGRSMVPVWVGAGVAVAGLALGIAGTIVTKNQRDTNDSSTFQRDGVTVTGLCKNWNEPQPGSPSDCAPPALSYVGGIGYGMLGAGAAFSLFYYLFGARSTADVERVPATAAEKRPAAPTVAVQPSGAVKF